MASPIFNYKTLIIVGIILFAISFVVAVAFPPIYAEHQDTWNILHSIISNQEQIIEKLDWNNCAMQNQYKDLTLLCGERP